MSRLPPILAFAAPSGTGKTTLIEGLVRELVGRGTSVAVLKADAHRVALDRPGKDSWRFSEAGAGSVAVMSAERLALFERFEGERSLTHVIERLFPDAELVLAEGFRRSGLDSVRVRRAGGPSDEGWEPPLNLVAWASDGPVHTTLPVLPLDDHAAVADWICRRYLRPAAPRRPTVVCATGLHDPLETAVSAARRLGALLDAPAMVVSAAGGASRADVAVVSDLRPQLGALGALFTGLAASDTPEILFVGPRRWAAPATLLRGLLAAGPANCEIVAPRVDGHPEPALAVYGHRCLSSIQSALLGGELKMTGWWGQVRAHLVEPAQWRRWDPDGLGLP